MKRKTTMTVEEVRGIGRVCRLADRFLMQVARRDGNFLTAIGGSMWTVMEVRQHLAFASKLCVKSARRAKRGAHLANRPAAGTSA